MDALDKQRQRILVSFLDEFQSELMFGRADRVVRRDARTGGSADRLGRVRRRSSPPRRRGCVRRWSAGQRNSWKENDDEHLHARPCGAELDAAFRTRGCLPDTEECHPDVLPVGPIADLNAGLIVEARPSLPVLIIGGGFTITCTSSPLPQTAERRATLAASSAPEEAADTPGRPQHVSDSGMVEHSDGNLRRPVRDAIQGRGEGRNQSAGPRRQSGRRRELHAHSGRRAVLGNSMLINICRLRQRQCCTPLCAIP